MDADVVVQPQLCTGVGVLHVVATVHIVKVVSLRVGNSLALQIRAIVATDVLQIGTALEVEVLSTKVHRVRSRFDMQTGCNGPFCVGAVDVERFAVQHRTLNRLNVINRDVSLEFTKGTNVVVFRFDFVHDLLHLRISIRVNVVMGLNDVLEVFVVGCRQTHTIVICVRIAVDIDGVNNRLVLRGCRS